jgi:hypothetical protein
MGSLENSGARERKTQAGVLSWLSLFFTLA